MAINAQFPEEQADGGAWIVSDGHDQEALARFKPGDLVGPAYQFIQTSMNKKLREHASTPRLLWDPQFDHLSMLVVPKTLIAALWLQFANAIDGNRSYRRCST